MFRVGHSKSEDENPINLSLDNPSLIKVGKKPPYPVESDSTFKAKRRKLNSDHPLLPSVDKLFKKKRFEKTPLFTKELEAIPLLKMKLFTALRYAKNVCIFGATNKFKDWKRTNGYSTFASLRGRIGRYKCNTAGLPTITYFNYKLQNAQWYYKIQKDASSYAATAELYPREPHLDPLLDPRFKLSEEQLTLLRDSLATLEVRCGNCHMQAYLIAKYLWENNAGINKIELVSTINFDHCFILINRSGDLYKSSTGGNAWVIDPWYLDGIVYHASAFDTVIVQIQAYIRTQLECMKKTIDSTIVDDSFLQESKTQCQLICEINPHTDLYPTYSISPFYPLEYYYKTECGEHERESASLAKQFNEHYEKLQPSLEIIKNSTHLDFFASQTSRKTRDENTASSPMI